MGNFYQGIQRWDKIKEKTYCFIDRKDVKIWIKKVEIFEANNV